MCGVYGQPAGEKGPEGCCQARASRTPLAKVDICAQGGLPAEHKIGGKRLRGRKSEFCAREGRNFAVWKGRGARPREGEWMALCIMAGQELVRFYKPA